jgi:hypothetical protein
LIEKVLEAQLKKPSMIFVEGFSCELYWLVFHDIFSCGTRKYFSCDCLQVNGTKEFFVSFACGRKKFLCDTIFGSGRGTKYGRR